MADAKIEIEDLPPTITPGRADFVPAQKAGSSSNKLTIAQVLGLLNIADLTTLLHGSASKTALVAADELVVYGSVDAVMKRITLTNFWAQQKWRGRAIGEVVYIDTSKTGVDIPPSTTTDTVWIELTAGLITSGFNNGKLTSESVSGSAPLVLATAVISYASSPMVGQTIDLWNTEGRIPRPSTSPGTKQNDASQEISVTSDLIVRRLEGSGNAWTSTGAFTDQGATGASTTAIQIGTASIARQVSRLNLAAGGIRTDVETRMKSGGVKAYMRIA